MFKWVKNILHRKKDAPERISLNDDGFELYIGDTFKWGVRWNAVDKIEVFKEDLITYDLICMEFFDFGKDMIFPVNEEVEGFWEMVKRIKEVIPTSQQDWEAVVVKPAFARNPTVIYER